MIKKLFAVFAAAVVISSAFWGTSLFNTMAKEGHTPVLNRYYTAVQIKEGDSLWSIAQTYGENSGMNTKAYVQELKEMNHLGEDTIHTGQYLTVVYFSVEESSWTTENAVSCPAGPSWRSPGN